MKYFFLIFPAFAFAYSDAGAHNYDIVARVINFIIFAGILYYIIAEPIKKAYNNRIASISSRLEAVDKKLKASAIQKEQSLKSLHEARSLAENIINTAKKEVEILTAKVYSNMQNEIAFLEKSFEEQKEFEERKAVKSAVREIMNEVLSDDCLSINQDKFTNIVLKKVG